MFILSIIVKIIFFASLTGMIFIFFKKAPLLASLPKTSLVFETKTKTLTSLKQTIKQRIKNIPFIKDFSFENLLQKILSKTRVFALKIENKISYWLESLRTRAKNNNSKKQNDKYWEKLDKEKDDLPK